MRSRLWYFPHKSFTAITHVGWNEWFLIKKNRVPVWRQGRAGEQGAQQHSIKTYCNASHSSCQANVHALLSSSYCGSGCVHTHAVLGLLCALIHCRVSPGCGSRLSLKWRSDKFLNRCPCTLIISENSSESRTIGRTGPVFGFQKGSD